VLRLAYDERTRALPEVHAGRSWAAVWGDLVALQALDEIAALDRETE